MPGDFYANMGADDSGENGSSAKLYGYANSSGEDISSPQEISGTPGGDRNTPTAPVDWTAQWMAQKAMVGTNLEEVSYSHCAHFLKWAIFVLFEMGPAVPKNPGGSIISEMDKAMCVSGVHSVFEGGGVGGRLSRRAGRLQAEKKNDDNTETKKTHQLRFVQSTNDVRTCWSARRDGDRLGAFFNFEFANCIRRSPVSLGGAVRPAQMFGIPHTFAGKKFFSSEPTATDRPSNFLCSVGK